MDVCTSLKLIGLNYKDYYYVNKRIEFRGQQNWLNWLLTFEIRKMAKLNIAKYMQEILNMQGAMKFPNKKNRGSKNV